MAGKGRQATSLYRPIQLLYPLEVSLAQHAPEKDDNTPSDRETHETSDQATGAPDTPQDEPSDAQPLRRSGRAAAQEARDRLLAQVLDDTDSHLF